MKKRLFIISIICLIAFVVALPTSGHWFQTAYTSVKGVFSNSSKPSAAKNIKSYDPISFELISESAKKRIWRLTGNRNPSTAEIKEAEKLICYELRISHKSEPDILKVYSERSFEERIKYFTIDMQKNVRFVCGSDTTSCAMYHFERNFGVAPYLSIHLGFPAEGEWKTNAHQVIIQDEYFNIGEIILQNNDQYEN